MNEMFDCTPYHKIIEMVTLLLSSSEVGNHNKLENILEKKKNIDKELATQLDRFIFGRKYKYPKALPIYESFSDIYPEQCYIQLTQEDIAKAEEAYTYFEKTIKPLFEAVDNFNVVMASNITSLMNAFAEQRKAYKVSNKLLNTQQEDSKE